VLAVTAFGQLAGCAGRATQSGSEESGGSASASSGVGGTGGEPQTNLDGGCAVDPLVRESSSGRPCPKAGQVCGAGACAIICTCSADAGALTWECAKRIARLHEMSTPSRAVPREALAISGPDCRKNSQLRKKLS
jgi:hypothetical protein